MSTNRSPPHETRDYDSIDKEFEIPCRFLNREGGLLKNLTSKRGVYKRGGFVENGGLIELLWYYKYSDSKTRLFTHSAWRERTTTRIRVPYKHLCYIEDDNEDFSNSALQSALGFVQSRLPATGESESSSRSALTWCEVT